ncbi:MAG: ribosomal protein [Ignavibacteria bacterium]|nr:ribosomal protein [Ignavibacteria bacterium]
MRHNVKGRKLKRTASHRKALMANMATSLFEHKKIHTTEAKAKELRPFAERLITKAKHALSNEKQHLLPEGQEIDIHNRREVGRIIRRKAVLQELFDSIAPVVEERAGGYTRIVKTGFRHGDGGATAVIELVDWSAPVDGAANLKAKKKRKAKKKPGTAPVIVETVIPQAEEVSEFTDAEVIDVVEEEVAEEVQVVETPVEETIEAPVVEEAAAVVAEPEVVEAIDAPEVVEAITAPEVIEAIAEPEVVETIDAPEVVEAIAEPEEQAEAAPEFIVEPPAAEAKEEEKPVEDAAAEEKKEE